MSHWSQPRAAASALLMIQLAAEYGVSMARCLAGTGMSRDDVTDPARQIMGQQELAVLRNILRSIHPSVPFGLLAGMRYHTTTHGMWGFTVMSSPTVRSAIEIAVRYFDLTFSFNRFRFEADRHQARMFYDEVDNPDDLKAVLVERDIGALITYERETVGQVIPAQALSFRAQRPAYPDPLQALFGVAPRYNASENCVAFDAELLKMEQLMGDELARRLGEDQCRALVEQRGTGSGTTARVRSRLIRTPGEFPRMEAVAAEFGMSTRTLRNHLEREATSYRELLEQARQKLAEQLLTTDMTVDAIGERLGYADTSSFIAAFKRWKGVPPRRYKGTVLSREQH
jgi:AraC-like DNA-binding protein